MRILVSQLPSHIMIKLPFINTEHGVPSKVEEPSQLTPRRESVAQYAPVTSVNSGHHHFFQSGVMEGSNHACQCNRSGDFCLGGTKKVPA